MHNHHTLTSITEDSYHDRPLKPTFRVELMSRKMETIDHMVRKNSQQVLQTIQNQQFSNNQISSHLNEVPSCVVYQDPNDSKLLNAQKNQQVYYTLINSVFNSGNTKMMPSGKAGNEKRSSLSNYNKRVVELTQHSSSSNETLLRVAPTTTTKSQNSNMLSLDLSEIPINDAIELQAKVNEIKRRLAESKATQSKLANSTQQLQDENYLQSTYEHLMFSNEKSQPKPKVNAISTNISPKPKHQELYVSPKLQTSGGLINSGAITQGNTNSKSKLTLRKQGAAGIREQVKNIINLNRSDQCTLSTLNPNITTDIYVSNSQQAAIPQKSSSPQLTRMPQTKTQQTTANSRKGQVSTSQLIRNLSQEGKSLRVSQSIKDLTTASTKETLKSHRLTNAFENKRESLRQSNPYYSPPQISLNKAISRISSNGDIRSSQDSKSLRQRKSINSNSKNVSAYTSGLSTIHAAQLVMKQASRQSSRKTADNLHYKQNSKQDLKDDDIDDQDCVEDLDKEEGRDEDDDYMTNQEKLWNAIETQMGQKAIEDILRKSDVRVDAKNVFDDGWTALHYAVHEGSFDIVKLLVERFNCLIDQRSSTNKTPFHLACIRGDELTIKYLLEKGASTTVVDRDGCTPLHYLCESQNYEMVKLLIPLCQVSKDVRNRFGKKPADLVCDKDIKRLLRRDTSQSRRGSQQLHHSRDRSLSSNAIPQQKIVKVVKLEEDQEVQKSIQQLFRKFSLFAGKKMGVDLSQVQTKKRELELDIDKKIEEIKQNMKSKNQTASKLASPSAVTSTITSKRLSSKPAPSCSSQQQYKQSVPKVQPQSCRNAAKSTQSKLFPTTQNGQCSNIVSQNVSPARVQIQTVQSKPSKQLQRTLNTSQSQQSLSTTSRHHHTNSTRCTSQLQMANSQIQQQAGKKLSTIRSVSNLLSHTHQKSIKLENEEIREEEYGTQDDSDEIEIEQQKHQALTNSNSVSAKNFYPPNDDQNSQRTGESSHIKVNEQDQVSLTTTINKTNKMTTFSMNQLSESNKGDDGEPKVVEKVGPASFIAHQLLGTGSFGEVFLVEKISNAKYYAMKVLTKSKIMGHNLTRYALTERNVMSCVDHPFIVKLNYAFQTQEKLFLILDYCPGGDLAEYLQLEKKFNEDKVRLYSSEILLALEELHRKDIIFRDLKPDNVVLDADGHALLTDFGLSKEGVMKEGMAKSFCGSYAYLAPEMLKKVGHGKAVDWYLLGVIIYEMLCGIPPYYANNKEELFENIKHSALDIPSHVSPMARDLITKLLNRNPKKRLGTFGGAEELKRHPFFKVIDWQKLYRRAYRPPEPYLRRRFDNFLQMTPQMQTNAEVYEQLRQQAQYTVITNAELHVPGWSFVSPTKDTE